MWGTYKVQSSPSSGTVTAATLHDLREHLRRAISWNEAMLQSTGEHWSPHDTKQDPQQANIMDSAPDWLSELDNQPLSFSSMACGRRKPPLT